MGVNNHKWLLQLLQAGIGNRYGNFGDLQECVHTVFPVRKTVGQSVPRPGDFAPPFAWVRNARPQKR